MELIAKNNKEIINLIEDKLFESYWVEVDRDRLYVEEKKKETNELLNYMENASEEEYKYISQLLFGLYLNKIFNICNEYLDTYFMNVHYIAPLRASAQRYYRLQGLAVDEIDPMGENIPMALKHLGNRGFCTFLSP